MKITPAPAQERAVPTGAGPHPAREIRTFDLGMPHLKTDGVDPGWLLREACHLHWRHVGRHLGCRPSRIVDEEGRRCFASVVACTVIGDCGTFHEDQTVELEMVAPPTPETAWRSETHLRRENGSDRIRVELLTRFVRRAGSGNVDLVAADPGPGAAMRPDDPQARRAGVLWQLGASDRKAALRNDAPPHLSFRIDAAAHLNGVGLVYFAALQDLVSRAEANTLPELGRAMPTVNRRLHFFGNMDAGDTLDLVTTSRVAAFSPMGCVQVMTAGRRRSDNDLVLFAESLFRI